MSNLVSLCQQIEEFLGKNDSHTIEQFLHWIEQRFHDRSLINTSQFFNCQCGHRYSLRFQLLDNHNEQNQIHDCEERKLDELQSLEQLIPPDTTEPSNTARMTQFGLPKLTDSMVEIIHSDGKRQFRCPLCFNSYVNRSGLNRHYITHSSQDLWKVGRYSIDDESINCWQENFF